MSFEFLEFIDDRAHAYPSKLRLALWRIVERGKKSFIRRLTERGISFAKGELQYPNLLRAAVFQEWIPHPETGILFISDLGD